MRIMEGARPVETLVALYNGVGDWMAFKLIWRRLKVPDQSVLISIGVAPNWFLNARVMELAFS